MYWRICWGLVTPVLMIAILLYALVTMKPETYNNEPFPTGAYGNVTNVFTFLLKCNKNSHVVRVMKQARV